MSYLHKLTRGEQHRRFRALLAASKPSYQAWNRDFVRRCGPPKRLRRRDPARGRGDRGRWTLRTPAARAMSFALVRTGTSFLRCLKDGLSEGRRWTNKLARAPWAPAEQATTCTSTH
eukprot:CAMPEP_0170287608 /NCGR_PEP_ID=MMETSP0116_2-20130129/43862_1 /TAXON_ID=400756 /ORGANISM="Durinskia baltica, Strain CSIRO CS-38" /LENGTH=116 /DNA_ID=CAMNT_0010539027 /DNA_START=187 /DNA_END=534 /DNA_ORIENTATION=-